MNKDGEFDSRVEGEMDSEEMSEEIDGGSGEQAAGAGENGVAGGRTDPFAALELPPPVGADDELADDWDGEEFSEDDVAGPPMDPNADHSALGAAGGAPSKGTADRVEGLMNDLDMFGGMGAHGGDPDLDAFNDPSVEHLDDPPFIGGQGGTTDLFGQTASSPMGRATSPRLYAQASQFPTCTQLRAWKWDNGVPVGLGVVDAMATEEDMVRQFFDAMPRRGEGRAQFKLRPIDINGQEMGKEINVLISEHHSALQQMRAVKDEEMAHRRGMGWGDTPPEDPTATMASEMSRMMDGVMRQTDRRTSMLEDSLEAERERMRMLDEERAQERIDMAMNAANGVQALTERMMKDEGNRSDRAMHLQTEQSNMLINTLTSVFGNQGQMMQQFAQQQQVMDNRRLEREQQRAEREKQDMEVRRKRDQEEFERRRQGERDELGEKRKEMDDGRRWERDQQEVRRKEEDRKWERQMEEMRLRVEKDRQDLERRMQRDRDEMLLKLKMEQQEQQQKVQWERERMDRDEKRRKEEGDRQTQLNREHQERMARFTTLEKESQRESGERRERLEREAREATEKERDRRHSMLMKEMELGKERDREHAERMLTLSQREMESKGLGSLTELVPKATGLLREFGLEPADIVGRLLGAQEESSGWMESLPKMLGVASEVVKAGLSAKGGMPAIPGMGAPAALPPPQMDMDAMMYQQQMAAAQQQQSLRPRRRQMQQQQHMQQQARPPQAAPQKQGPPPQGRPQPESMEDPPPVQQESGADPSIRARPEGMKLKDQRKARNAIRKLVRKMVRSEHVEWEGMIVTGIASEVAIYHYIQAVGLKSAVAEAGGDPEFIRDLVKSLKSSEIVPADLNYGEET